MERERYTKGSAGALQVASRAQEGARAPADDLAKLLAQFKDTTNHDHAQNLPATIASVQSIVKECLHALESQQWCHNVGCNSLPERNAIVCLNAGADILERLPARERSKVDTDLRIAARQRCTPT